MTDRTYNLAWTCGCKTEAEDVSGDVVPFLRCPRHEDGKLLSVTPTEPIDEVELLLGVAGALGRALHPEDDGEQFWGVCVELEKDFPQISWHNAMTDGGSKAKPALQPPGERP